MPNIHLQSCDGITFAMDVEIAKQSSTLKILMEDIGPDEIEEEVIPMPDIYASTLKQVIQWCTFHKNDHTLPVEDVEFKEKRTDDHSSWDANFLKIDQGTLFELILAANYLEIAGLMELTCKSVAHMMKGKSPEEIRTIFKIENDFTPEELAQVHKENEWAEERRH